MTSYASDYSVGGNANTNDGRQDSYASVQRGAESPNTPFIANNTEGVVNEKKIRKKSWSDAASQMSDDEPKSPMYMAIYNMLAGCGIVGLPLQTKQSGIIPGIILMAIVAIFSTYTLRLLIKNGRRVKVWNYEDLCQKCWGVYG